jgi:NAD(P)H-dependent flavin oxidoreductase YrpB (nitropropane dioxygenase family)
VSAPTRLRQAVSEGDGIALIARVDSEQDAQRAAGDGADALLLHGGKQDVLDAIRGTTTSLPVLFYWDRDHAGQLDGADACVVDARGERDSDWLHHVHREVGDTHEIALRVEDEEHLELALEEFDPEIVILAAEHADAEEALEEVLDLLPDVPAGKLAIAELAITSRDDVAALERAGMDGVIVDAASVGRLAADEPPDV